MKLKMKINTYPSLHLGGQKNSSKPIDLNSNLKPLKKWYAFLTKSGEEQDLVLEELERVATAAATADSASKSSRTASSDEERTGDELESGQLTTRLQGMNLERKRT